MTDKEWIETLPTASNKELMESLDYFGYDSYYRTCREPLVAEITKRLNQLTEKDKQIEELQKENAELKAQIERLQNCWNCKKSFTKSCTFGKKLEAEKKKCKEWEFVE